MKIMDIGVRLKVIANMVEECDTIVDVGTDHGYVPIYLVKNGVIKKAIASDINRGPVEKAKNNIMLNKVCDQISCRLGGGLSTVKKGEVQVAVSYTHLRAHETDSYLVCRLL